MHRQYLVRLVINCTSVSVFYNHCVDELSNANLYAAMSRFITERPLVILSIAACPIRCTAELVMTNCLKN